jgi:hypothetical protein
VDDRFSVAIVWSASVANLQNISAQRFGIHAIIYIGRDARWPDR